MVGDDAESRGRAGDLAPGAISERLQDGLKELAFVDGTLALQHGDGTFDAHAGIHIMLLQGHEGALGGFCVLQKDIIPDFEILAAGAARAALRPAGRLAAINEHFRIRPAGPGIAGRSPPVIGHGQEENPFIGQAHFAPEPRGFLIGGHLVIALKDSHIKVGRREVQIGGRGQEGIGPSDGFFLKIIAQRPAAQHLKESQVGGVAHGFDIAGAHAFLHIAQAFTGRMRFTQQIGHQRVHPSGGEEHRRIILRQQGGARNEGMAPLFKKAEKHLPQFAGR